jgi:type I restriction enzyme, S subunit
MTRTVALGDVVQAAPVHRAGGKVYPVLSMTMREGLVDQAAKFKKRVASANTADYKVVGHGQLVVGFPIDEGVLAFQRLYPEAVVSPAYGVWDLQDQKCTDRNYLERFLRSPRAITYYRAKLRGSTARRRSLPRDVFLEMPVPLPPIGEQRRIAAVLDAADALRTKRRQALAKLDTLTQAIFIDMFGDPLSNACDHQRSVLGDLVEFVGGGTPAKAILEFFDGEICWATSKDMGGRFLDDTRDHITMEAVQSSATKLVPAGTVLVVVKSKVLAHRLPVAISRVPTCFGQDLKGLIPKGGSTPEFVAGALVSGQRWLLSRARGVNTEGLTLDQLRRFPVATASRQKMEAFQQTARAVEDWRKVVSASLAQLDLLFASLEQRAFRGEL